jgi:ferredoxin like protein
VVDDQLDLRLATLVFRADPEPHIVVQTDLCLDCAERPCLFACPTCEGCLECGSCRVVCHREAVSWRYPRGGFGVRYRWG